MPHCEMNGPQYYYTSKPTYCNINNEYVTMY